jgi:pimeloyl-ACP methyl ester carboxylesterase
MRRRSKVTIAALAASAALAAGTFGTAAPAAAEPGRLSWHTCRTDADDPVGAELDRIGAQCADVAVPLDYSRPRGRTITVAISRLPAADRANRVGALLLNGGGPGGTGIDMPLLIAGQETARSRFDLIGMDPRFVGRSTPLDCGWPTGTWIRSAGHDRRSFDRMTAFQADLAKRCADREPDLIPHASTRDTARDMDVIRAALGERRLSYLGYSYGTYLGAVYTQMFPHRTDRVVLDSAVDPDGYGPRLLRDNGPAIRAGLRDWAGWAAEHHDEYGLGATPDAVIATVTAVDAAAARTPLRVGPYTVDEHVVPALVFSGLYDDRDAPNAELAGTVRVLHRAAVDGAADPTPALAEQLRFITTGEESHYGSVQASILCADRAAPRDPDVYRRDIEAHRVDEPVFAPLIRNLGPCAFWPTAPRERPTDVDNRVPALVVQSTGDVATTYDGGRAMHRAMAGSRLLTLRDARIHAVYANYGNACVDGRVNGYLRTGVLPARDISC